MTEHHKKMRVVEIGEPGGPEALRIATRARPAPGDSEILIEVAAAGVNRPDVMQRQGFYPPPAGAPDWPGLEVAGTVAALGSGASRFALHDKVIALVPGGGYADYVTVHETNAVAAPHGLSFVEAAGIPETFFTVWHNVFQRGGLKAGETVLVHGGTSGIGTTAIQLAGAFGARVFATAGSDEKCRAAEKLGAEVCINYKTADFVAALKEATGGHGIDLTLDMIGGDYTARNIEVAAEDGRIVQIAVQKGAKADIDLFKIMRKRLTLTGSTLRNRPVAVKATIAEELSTHVLPLIASGRVKPLIDATYPLEKAADAHRHMDDDHIGKIILTTGLGDEA
ncbi:NAD(P)H-quinone oxidoreductase [Jiella sp. MQZ9-1]|uniref:NAD(P)H-quinone oxidoreductase n=1 Tax=Jiella flava TaxID=2816857 RepID=A0A939FT14_9HYPH|nr:NAD(P)H-quinone oxidoreductase [Jiella flava]MBO0661017.1 NAD(P)H-quinone oxidoreductase [Jiella flava]MCD2469665.1 NAD(P)H-quinone oxidoreductase [Jiella flava]